MNYTKFEQAEYDTPAVQKYQKIDKKILSMVKLFWDPETSPLVKNIIDNILESVQNEGVNFIQLPLSLENIIDNPYPENIDYAINPELKWLKSNEVIKKTIEKA